MHLPEYTFFEPLELIYFIDDDIEDGGFEELGKSNVCIQSC